MKLLITADKIDGCVELPSFVVYDLETQKQTLIPYQKELDSPAALNSGRETFRPFGMCKTEDSLYVASNDRLAEFSLDGYKFTGLLGSATLFVNTHQVYFHNSTTYITNAANDSLGIYDGNSTEFFSFQNLSKVTTIPYPIDAYQLDRKHINSVTIHQELLYVVAHRDTQFGSAIYCIDPKTWLVQKRIPAGIACHGVQMYQDNAYTLSTGTGDLFEISLTEDKITRYFVVDPNMFFLRGLQRHGDKLYFVASTNFHNPDTNNGCFLYVFDLVKKQIETKIDLAPIIVVNDILITE